MQTTSPANERTTTARPIGMMDASELAGALDEAAAALTSFDTERLETIECRVRTLTSTQLANARGLLPKLIEKHALLGQMLDATAANLKVIVSLMNLETRTEMR